MGSLPAAGPGMHERMLTAVHPPQQAAGSEGVYWGLFFPWVDPPDTRRLTFLHKKLPSWWGFKWSPYQILALSLLLYLLYHLGILFYFIVTVLAIEHILLLISRYGLTKLPRLALNSLCSQGRHWTFGSPASVSPITGISASFLNFYIFLIKDTMHFLVYFMFSFLHTNPRKVGPFAAMFTTRSQQLGQSLHTQGPLKMC